MFTRSTRGCGQSGFPNLALAVCLCPKLNGSARRPGLRLLREPGRLRGQESVRRGANDGYILGIYQVYTVMYMFWVNTALWVTLTCSLLWSTWSDVYPFIWDLVGACFTLEIMHKCKNWSRWIHCLYQVTVYANYIPGIYQKLFQHWIASLNFIFLIMLGGSWKPSAAFDWGPSLFWMCRVPVYNFPKRRL